MKKFFTFLFISVFSSLLMYSSDIIVMNNGDIVKAKVLEITQNEVKYKVASRLDGPLYTINKSDVLSITYDDGVKETFSNYSNTFSSDGEIKINIDYDNSIKLGKYNTCARFRGNCQDKPAKNIVAQLSFTKNSVLSSKELSVSWNLSEHFGRWGYSINLHNKSNHNIYIDLANCFKTSNTGLVSAYYDGQHQCVSTSSSTSGLGFGFLGIGLFGSGTESHTVITTPQRIVTLPPGGNFDLSFESPYLDYFKFKRGIVNKGYTKAFSELDSPLTQTYTIRYSNTESMKEYLTLTYTTYISEIHGRNEFKNFGEVYLDKTWVNVNLKKFKNFVNELVPNFSDNTIIVFIGTSKN